MKNGNGTLYDDDGSVIYEGEWVDDKQNGYGTSYYPDGSVYKGLRIYTYTITYKFKKICVNISFLKVIGKMERDMAMAHLIVAMIQRFMKVNG
jgi:hypothetical protein